MSNTVRRLRPSWRPPPIARGAPSRPATLIRPPRWFARPAVSLAHPSFEGDGLAFWRLWLRRFQHRRALRRLRDREADAVLADFGTSRAELTASVERPFWRA